MRMFKTSPFGYEEDLDNPKTFSYLPNSIKELRTLMLSEIGFHYCYVNYWHPLDFDMQRKNVERLIKDFTENERLNYKNIIWYKEQIFLFQNEIENMC